tara:strand:+ start:359 stop:748 length:390 start_codon:yes stop_codon:yes gene_type:complete
MIQTVRRFIMNTDWYPEIMYEEQDDGVSSKIPFVMVPSDKQMPELLYIFESRETGEFEPGLDGEPLPILEMDLHQYADMLILKQKLSQETYDEVRIALGLQPMEEAVREGRKITNNIRDNLKEKTQTTP